MSNSKSVSIVIPVYKPEKETMNRLMDILKRQTIKAEVIETENLPEAESMNVGIKKAKGKIVVTLAQDCVPKDIYWLENLIKPLEDPNIIVSVSRLILPKWYWKRYPFFTKMLTINELISRRSNMDARACAFRRQMLLDVGMFTEDPKIIAIDGELYMKIKDKGKMAYPHLDVMHCHPLTNSKKLKLDYKYAYANGMTLRMNGLEDDAYYLKMFRAIPFLGFASYVYVFPIKKYYYYFPLYVLFSLVSHMIWIYGFWKGFLTHKRINKNGYKK